MCGVTRIRHVLLSYLARAFINMSLMGWVWVVWGLCTPVVMGAEAARVAVASNFTETARVLATAYQTETGHRVQVSSGSTGMLYAQIRNGAPFDIFLAANDSEPARLAAEGYAAGAPFTYALGRLALWSADARLIDGDCATVLRRNDYRRLALANPRLAPYGAAALAVLQRIGLADRVKPRLVMGENVAQAFQFIATGNAEVGFVAYAQIITLPRARAGSACLVDAALYPPIRQHALLLKRGAGNKAAEGFVHYLQGERAIRMLIDAGYAVPRGGE